MKSTEPPIVVEETYQASLKIVWSALTDAKEMRRWYFNVIEDFRPEVGFSAHFVIEVNGRKFTHRWKVTEVIPEQKITYHWTFDEYPGDSYATFELIDKGSQVMLRLTAVVVENFPQDIPEFKRQSGVDGWNYFIRQSLKEYLASR